MLFRARTSGSSVAARLAGGFASTPLSWTTAKAAVRDAWRASAALACRTLGSERLAGIEPALPPWQGGVLPLNYSRVTQFLISIPDTPMRRRSDRCELLLGVVLRFASKGVFPSYTKPRAP